MDSGVPFTPTGQSPLWKWTKRRRAGRSGVDNASYGSRQNARGVCGLDESDPSSTVGRRWGAPPCEVAPCELSPNRGSPPRPGGCTGNRVCREVFRRVSAKLKQERNEGDNAQKLLTLRRKSPARLPSASPGVVGHMAQLSKRGPAVQNGVQGSTRIPGRERRRGPGRLPPQVGAGVRLPV